MGALSARSATSSIIIIFISYILYNVYIVSWPTPEEFLFSTSQFIEKYGYKSENHIVNSFDGVKTTIFRVLPASGEARGYPVLLEGGLFCSSDLSVTMGPNRDLAFILVDAGFDVWLGNYRGNRYGQLPENISETAADFGFHEMTYDIAPTIDHILKVTSYKKVKVAAASLGSPCMLLLLATQPEYNEKIDQLLHLGGTLNLRLGNFFQKLFFNTVWKFPAIGVSIFPPYRYRENLMRLFCESSLSSLCLSAFDDLVGVPVDNNATIASLTLTLLPSGAPMGVLDHMMQLSHSGAEFRMRDYGKDRNLKIYNSTKPPLYDMSRVSVWSKTYQAEFDALADSETMDRVFKALQNPPEKYVIPRPFRHSNFFMNSARDRLFIEDVVATLQQH